jgi:hypothetical protein
MRRIRNALAASIALAAVRELPDPVRDQPVMQLSDLQRVPRSS